MFLKKIKAKNKRNRRSLTRIFASRSSTPDQPSKPDQPSQLSTTNGRQFVLPYDLLEEIAKYIPRRKAAPLLTVNSQFHDAFARAVWRRLYLDDDRVDRISASAWETYGHLVRFATVKFYGPHEHLDVVRMPNVIDLTVYLTYRGYNIFEGAELSNLRRLHLKLPQQGWTSFAAVKGAELAQRVGQPGHPIAVDWDIYAEKYRHVAALDDLLDPIVDTAPHTFKITAESKHPVTLEQLPKLAEMLTELDLHHSPFVFDCFLGNSDISFPRLVKLAIGSSCFDEEENDGPVDANILIPDRFPVLQRLSFAYLSRSDLEWLEVAFSHNWASISELAFLDSSSYLEFATIANHVPNLTRLTVKGYDNSLNINLAAGHWPHLQHLDIDSPVRFQYDASNNPQPQLTSLKSFIFTTTWSMGQNSIRQQILDFILHGAPNLELIELNEGCFHESVLSMARDQVNLSVRTLSIEIELDRFDAVTAKMFIGMFPNLKLLKAKGKDYAAIQQLKEDHPDLRIQYC